MATKPLTSATRRARRKNAPATRAELQSDINLLNRKLGEQETSRKVEIDRLQTQHTLELKRLSGQVADGDARIKELEGVAAHLKTELMATTIETATMSGYITRANENDPPRIIQVAEPIHRNFGNLRNLRNENAVSRAVDSEMQARDAAEGGYVRRIEPRDRGWWNLP